MDRSEICLGQRKSSLVLRNSVRNDSNAPIVPTYRPHAADTRCRAMETTPRSIVTNAHTKTSVSRIGLGLRTVTKE